MTEKKPRLLTPSDILQFWFSLDEKVYWRVDEDFDRQLAADYGRVLEQAKSGAMDNWCGDEAGTMALVIILDQFSRNIHRGTPEMFASDEHARTVSSYAINAGITDYYEESRHRRWLFMPFMHSESLADQKYCVAMCQKYELDETLPHAIEHMEIIKRFGRFPHRNKILSRQTTSDEQAFLDSGGFAG